MNMYVRSYIVTHFYKFTVDRGYKPKPGAPLPKENPGYALAASHALGADAGYCYKYLYVAPWSRGTVCRLCVKTAELIEMPFGGQTPRVGRRNHVLDGGGTYGRHPSGEYD